MASYNLLLLPGDGIGPEVMGQVSRIIDWLNARSNSTGASFETEHALVGGAAYDTEGAPVSDETVTKAQNADAVLLGAVGGPKWDNLPFVHKPERGLLRLRKDLELYANLRPALCYSALADASSLKRELVEGLDILIVRELTGGVYFGEPRGIEDLADGERRGINTQVYTTSEIRRVARVAFDLAGKRNSKLCSVEKSNVMESGVLWREEVTWIHDNEYAGAGIDFSHMLADNCAMQLVRYPKQFDVIVTDNLFGDMLSDAAAMLTGSLGMLPSASLGDSDENGRRKALYEPVHGTAPDIAGQDLANPLAMIGSFAMALKYSCDMGEEADRLDQAIANTLEKGLRTADIAKDGDTPASTEDMGTAVIAELEALSA
jgi:3-isopropylmalate dehydrogenase